MCIFQDWLDMLEGISGKGEYKDGGPGLSILLAIRVRDSVISLVAQLA